MNKVIGRILAVVLIAGGGLLAVAAPAQANSSSCSLHPYPWENVTECYTGIIWSNFAHEVYVTDDSLWGFDHAVGWDVIDVSNNVVVGSGGCYKCTVTIGGLYGTYKVHLWGQGGRVTLSN